MRVVDKNLAFLNLSAKISCEIQCEIDTFKWVLLLHVSHNEFKLLINQSNAQNYYSGLIWYYSMCYHNFFGKLNPLIGNIKLKGWAKKQSTHNSDNKIFQWGPRRPNPLKFCKKVVLYITINCSKFHWTIPEIKDFIVIIVSGLVIFCSPFTSMTS